MRFNQFLQNTCMLNAMMLVMVDCGSVDGVDCMDSVLLLSTDLQSDLQGDLENVCNASLGNCLLQVGEDSDNCVLLPVCSKD